MLIYNEGNNLSVVLDCKKLAAVISDMCPSLLGKIDPFPVLNISRETLNKYLSNDGEVNIRPRTALDLCYFLDISPGAVLKTTGEHPRVLELSKNTSAHNIYDNGNANNFMSQATTTEQLTLSDEMNNILRDAATGLICSEGIPGRVSASITNILINLVGTVDKTDKLKELANGLVDEIISTLLQSELCLEYAAMAKLWSCIRTNCEELKALSSLPPCAINQMDDVITEIKDARKNDNNSQKLAAIKAAIWWLQDFWQYVQHKTIAYCALRDLSYMLDSAPTDYDTRSGLVKHLNLYSHYINIYDPVSAALPKYKENLD